MSSEQKAALQQAVCKYRGELHALASERKQLNAVLAQAAAPGKSDGIKKVICSAHASCISDMSGFNLVLFSPSQDVMTYGGA